VNRAARGRANPSDDRGASAAGIEAVNNAAAGALDVLYVSRDDVIPLIVAASLGNAESIAILQAIQEILQHITAAPADNPRMCGCCNRAIIGAAFLIVVAEPMDKPLAKSQVLCTTQCLQCQSYIPTNALRALQRVWPEARPITVHPGVESVH
jgi:hypothetical protein